MRVRVTETMHRQLAELRDSKTAPKGGVMLVPPMLSPEEWEAEAEPHQRALMEWSMETHSGADVRQPAPVPMTAQEERAFDHHMRARRHSGMTEEQKAARAFTNTMRQYR